MRSQLTVSIVGLTFCALVTFGCTASNSDESILRAEFNVPKEATVVSYKAHPDQNAWVREGLDIEIIFQLSGQDYEAYVADAERDGLWQPLPIPEEFLMRMGAIESRLEAYKSRTQLSQSKAPRKILTGTQLLNEFVALLPETPKAGLFQCRSAGDNIMYAPKTIHTRLDRDLNDFMLAMLDHERERIVIRVNTSY